MIMFDLRLICTINLQPTSNANEISLKINFKNVCYDFFSLTPHVEFDTKTSLYN